jgi:CDP-glucose 4,6-dehydratase
MGQGQGALEDLEVNGFDWAGRRVLVTGHTGFKGAWLSLWLLQKRAQVAGLALQPDTRPSLFHQFGLADLMDHAIVDIRDAAAVRARVGQIKPEIVFHLAAQPLVRRSYREPVETWDTNVMGTVHVLDAVRHLGSACSIVAVTTDKVYENREVLQPYQEADRLGGHDPYSASKAGCELVVDSFRKAFFIDGMVRLASARAGNVIGGGDWSEDRIVPDLVRALAADTSLAVRNPNAVRPWQHVLDPLMGYILLAEHLVREIQGAQSAFNFAPDLIDQRDVRSVVDTALRHWPGRWHDESQPGAVHEAGLLVLATDKARSTLGWQPRWDFEQAVSRTIGWYRDVHRGADPRTVTLAQLRDFEAAG